MTHSTDNSDEELRRYCDEVLKMFPENSGHHYPTIARALLSRLTPDRDVGIEAAALWHDEQAAKLRAMNMPRNVEAIGGIMDTIRWDTADEHDTYAANIRALKSSPATAPDAEKML